MKVILNPSLKYHGLKLGVEYVISDTRSSDILVGKFNGILYAGNHEDDTIDRLIFKTAEGFEYYYEIEWFEKTYEIFEHD